MDVTTGYRALGLGGLVEFFDGFDANWTVLRHEMQVTLDLMVVMFTRDLPHAARRYP